MLTMLKSLHRRAIGIDKDDKVIAPSGFAAGGDGKPSIIFPGPDTVAVFEDFLFRPVLGFGVQITDTGGNPVVTLNDTGTLGEYFRVRKNAATQTAVLKEGTNGVGRVTMTISGATGTIAASSAMLVSPLPQWKANQGPGGQSGRLRFGTRLKVNSFGLINSLFMGFTDKTYELDTGTKEFPIYDTGGAAALFAPASDAVGFLFGNLADTGWRGVSARGTTGDSGEQQVTLTTAAPTANTWATYELEVTRSNSDTGGTVHFYIDGVKKGTIASPIQTSALLNAIIAIADTGGSTILDVDWINISAPRDTGM